MGMNYLFLLLFALAGGAAAVRINVSESLPRKHGEQRSIERLAERTVDRQAQERFSQIYDNKIWSNEGRGSGLGSSKRATVVTMSIIRTVAANYSLETFLDAPCGAMEWQPLLLQLLQEDHPDFQYTGYDIVPSVIEDNKAQFADKENWHFDVRDVSKERLGKFDLIMSRDALQHLPCEMVVDALANFASSRPKYILLGSYDSEANINIQAGDYSDINLRNPPYSLEDGLIRAFSEHTSFLLEGGVNKLLLLYSGSYLASQDFVAMKRRCSGFEE